MERDYSKVRIHIEYNEMSLIDVAKSLNDLNDTIYTFYEEKDINFEDEKDKLPIISSFANGSLITEILVPISCTVLPILCDFIMGKYRNNDKYRITVMKTQPRHRWSRKEDYNISKIVLLQTANQTNPVTIDELIEKIGNVKISYKSLRAKIQNTKQLMEENNIANRLDVAPLRNYSTQHESEFQKARKDLGI